MQRIPGAASAGEVLVLLAVTLPLAIELRLPTLWFVAPFLLITLTRRPYDMYGLTLRGFGSVRFHLIVTLVVLGGYCVAYYVYAHWFLGRTFQPNVAPDFAGRVLDQLVIVGLSEEFFFRGYAQTQFNSWLGRPYRFLGASWGPGLVIAAILFGLCHLVDGDITRLRVVFFGLFAGWLRERTDTIVVPAVYHGVSNVLHEFMQQSLQ